MVPGLPARNWRHARDIEVVIPDRSDELGKPAYSRDRHHKRPTIVNRPVRRRKRYRWTTTRYEKMASGCLPMATIACMLQWL